jgi:hypothetical protein
MRAISQSARLNGISALEPTVAQFGVGANNQPNWAVKGIPTACSYWYPFHRKRVTPENLGINVFSLQDFDPAGIPVRQAVGVAVT